MTTDVRVEAFVLAGGKSTRMGTDKGLAILNGKPMIAHILEALQAVGLPINIVAHHSAYETFGFPVYADLIFEKGPMGGLLTAMKNTKADVVLLIGCDMPLISPEAIHKLLSFLDREKIVAISVDDKVNPLFALYPCQLKQRIEEYVVSGQLKMTDFIFDHQYLLVSSLVEGMSICFKNVNTPQDLKGLYNRKEE